MQRRQGVKGYTGGSGYIARQRHKSCHLSVPKQSANFHGARFYLSAIYKIWWGRSAPRAANAESGFGFGGLLCAIAVLQLQLLLLLHSELFYICLPTFVRICLVSFISDCAVAFLSVFLFPSSSVCVCVCAAS